MMIASDVEPHDCYRVNRHTSSRLDSHLHRLAVPWGNTRSRLVSCKLNANLFLQDLPSSRVLLAEIETKTMKLMTTIEPRTNFRPGAKPLMTDDRVEICRPASLAEVVDAAVMGVERPLFKPGGAEVPDLAFQPRMMLAVLTYCYARQILSSSNVWSHLMRDAAFRKICQNAVLGPDRIRHFRDETGRPCMNASRWRCSSWRGRKSL
jgi:hypothetical protein